MIYHKKSRKQAFRFVTLYKLVSIISFCVVLVLFISFLGARRFSFKPRAEEVNNTYVKNIPEYRLDHFYQQSGPWADVELPGVAADLKCKDTTKYLKSESYIKGSGCGQTTVALILWNYFKSINTSDRTYTDFTPDFITNEEYLHSSCDGTSQEQHEQVLRKYGFTVERLIENIKDYKFDQSDEEKLKEYLNENWGLLALAFMTDPKDKKVTLAHFVWLIKYDEQLKSFISWDPYFGPGIVFSEYNPQYLFVSAFKKEL